MIRKPSHRDWKIDVEGQEFSLESDSLFIGSDSMCDISLKTLGVASFHIELIFKDGNWVFNCEDLGTSILVNEEASQRGEIRSGDLVQLGNAIIIFKENPYTVDQIPSFASFDDFEDIDSTHPLHSIAETVKTKKIEIINYHNGHIQDVNYLPLRHGSYSIGTNGDIPFTTIENAPLFTIEHRSIRFHPHSELNPSESWDKLSLGDTIFLTKGAEQVSLRIVQQSILWKPLPWSFDNDFWKVSAIVGLFIFLPFLALQFTDLPKAIPPKHEVVVIYKLKDTKSPIEKNAPSETPTETVAKAAAAPDGMDIPEVKASEEASKASTVAVAESRPIPAPAAKPIIKPIPQRKDAPVEVAAIPQPEKTQEVIVPKKTYSFNTSVTKSLVGPDSDMKLKVAKTKLADSSASFSTATQSEKSLVGKMNQGPGKLSEESSGTSLSSSSRGIASKSGFDTSSIDKNTVIRGSMDPEVLRKILREYIPQFRHCYQQELIYKSEKIKGVLDLDFTINAQGKTSRYAVRAKDARFSQRGIDCMGNVLAIIDFPKPKGGGIVDVSQPLNFFAEK